MIAQLKYQFGDVGVAVGIRAHRLNASGNWYEGKDVQAAEWAVALAIIEHGTKCPKAIRFVRVAGIDETDRINGRNR